MASAVMASFANLTLNPAKSVTSSLLKAVSTMSISLNYISPITATTSSSPFFIQSRGYKSNTYRLVKSYTFGMGQVSHGGHRNKRQIARYEKDPKTRPLKSGVPFGHRVLNYEHRYVSDVGYRAEYYKGGPKPRFNDDEKEYMKKYMTMNAPFDEWTEEKALFGQNDYIDILGDGNLSIRELNVDAPAYLRGWGVKGDTFEETQFHHVMRRLHFEEDYLLNLRPTRWWQLRRELTRHARECNRYKKRGKQRWALN